MSNKIQRKSVLLGLRTDTGLRILRYKRSTEELGKVVGGGGGKPIAVATQASNKKLPITDTLESTLSLIANAEKSLATSQVKVLENESASLKAENDALKLERAGFLTQKEQIGILMNQMETNIRKLQLELNEYQNSQVQHSPNVSDISLQAQVQQLQSELKKAIEEKNAKESKVQQLQTQNERLTADLKKMGTQKNVEVYAAMEALKSQLNESLKEIDKLKSEKLELEKENANLQYTSIQHELSAGINMELQKQLVGKKENEERAYNLAEKTVMQLTEQKNLNDQLMEKNQELQLDVEIIMEELERKEADLKSVIEDNNAMLEKLKSFGITVEFDEVYGRLVFN